MKEITRIDTVERQANYCKNHMRECQQQVNQFVNAQIENANQFYKTLAKTKEGKQKIAQIKKL